MDTRVRDLIKDQKLIVFHRTDTIEMALNKIWQFGIRGAPVVSVEAQPGRGYLGNEVLGFVDALDLVAVLVKECTKPMTHEQLESGRLTTDDYQLIVERTREFKMLIVLNAINKSGRDPCTSINGNLSVREALVYLKNRPRVLLVDPGGAITDDPIVYTHKVVAVDPAAHQTAKILGVLTQFDVIKHIHNTSDECCKIFPDLLKPIMDTHYKTEVPFVVNSDKFAINAFIAMHNRHISALPVIDKDTKTFMSVLSSSDIKILHDRRLSTLLNTLRDFIPIIRGHEGKDLKYKVTVDTKARVMDAINLIHQEKVHRVVVLNDAFFPIGLVTLSDILSGLHHVVLSTLVGRK